MGNVSGVNRSNIHTPPRQDGWLAGHARDGAFDWAEDIHESGAFQAHLKVIGVADRVSGALLRSASALLDARTYIHAAYGLGTGVGETAAAATLVVKGERTAAQEFPTTHRTVTNPAAQFEMMVKAPGGEWYDPQIWANNPAEAAAFTLETAAAAAPQAVLMAYGIAPVTANGMTLGEFAANTGNLCRAAGRAVGRGLDSAGETLFGPPGVIAVTPNGAMIIVPLAHGSETAVSTGVAVGAVGTGGRAANFGVAVGAATHQMSIPKSSSGGIMNEDIPFQTAKFETPRRKQLKVPDGASVRDINHYNALLDRLDAKDYAALNELEGVVNKLLDDVGASHQAQPTWKQLRVRLEALRKANPEKYTREHMKVSARIEQELDVRGGARPTKVHFRPDLSQEKSLPPPNRSRTRDAVGDMRTRDEVGPAARDVRDWKDGVDD